MSYSPAGDRRPHRARARPRGRPAQGRTRPWGSRPWAQNADLRPGSYRSGGATNSRSSRRSAAPQAHTRLITVPGRLRGTIKAAEQVLERTKADAVVGFGGDAALPAYLAAKRLGVPIVIHEANARPGLANKIGSRYAAQVAVSTPDNKLRGARYIGIPLRRSIATLTGPPYAPRRAPRSVSTPRCRPCWFPAARRARGASTRSSSRRLRPPAGRYPDPARGRPEERTARRSTRCRGMPPYIPVPYVDRMDLAYAAADMMLRRAR